MVVTSMVGIGTKLVLIFLATALHYSKGTGWESAADIIQGTFERRATTVAEIGFPEPMNRSIGGGGRIAAAGAGEESTELEDEEVEEEQNSVDMPEDEAEHFEAEFVKQGEAIELVNNGTVFDWDEDAEMDLPHACRQGSCTSCVVKITDGPAGEYITHHTQETLSGEEMDNGYTLTYVAYPKADFVIKTGEVP